MPIPDTLIPEFAELFSISDLHIGGKTGFQIFALDVELVRLIEHLTLREAEGDIALVINGDFVDFLAEEPYSHFDPEHAVEKLNRIMDDDSFKSIWAALQAFVATPGRALVITLGNHDIELALPWVRAHLLNRLAGSNADARCRIHLAFDGSGFLCRVGRAQVLCVHGNEGDDWNLIDHETLRRQGRNVMQGRATENWVPNAGTKLVIDVMNEVKKDYPFVDLLKPETEAVLPTLVALDPKLVGKVSDVAAVLTRKRRDGIRRSMGFLSSGAEIPVDGAPRRQSVRSADNKRLAESLLDEAEIRMGSAIDPMDLVSESEQDSHLGVFSAIIKGIARKPRAEVLREALEFLKKDRSFELKGPDETFDHLDKEVGGEVTIIVAGHTHLERSMPRRLNSGWYFNSGTWARLIQLKHEILNCQEAFDKAFQAFGTGGMQALDDMNDFVIRRPTVVHIGVKDRQTFGRLLRVTATGSAIFDEVENSRYGQA